MDNENDDIKIEQDENRDNFENFLDINKNNLNDKLTDIASWFDYCGEQENVLKDNLDDVKHELKLAIASKKTAIRNKYRSSGIKMTETELNDMVFASSSVVQELEKEVIETNKLLRSAKLRMTTLKVTLDSLGHLSNNVRAERQANINKRKREFN